MNIFQPRAEFLLLDSESLEDVRTRLYGYSVQSTGIYEDENLTAEAVDHLDGCGCYLYVNVDKDSIRIHQDNNGSWGLYLYEKDGYFALSSSLFLLLEHVIPRGELSLNKDCCTDLLLESLVGIAYQDTLVNEIRRIDRNATVCIDKLQRTISFDYKNPEEQTVGLDSQEAIDTIDQWVNRWTTIFRNVCRNTSFVQTDLSDGFDSRMTFMLMLLSGQNLNTIRVHSIDDSLHTHSEDFQIATEIAQKFGIELNRALPNNKAYFYTMEDAVNISYYAKMGIHKEFHYQPQKLQNKLYSVTGSGGEVLRNHWNYSAEEFVDYCRKFADNRRYCGNLPQYLQKEAADAIERVIRKNYDLLREQLHLSEKDAMQYPAEVYKNCRCGSHFGRGMIERYFANHYELAPLLDPMIRKIKLHTNDCNDDNLLFALIYVRYCPELLEIRYDGKRRIEPETIECAKKMNQRFEPYCNKIVDSEFNVMVVDNHLPECSNLYCGSGEVTKYYRHVFDSDALRKRFATCFDEEYYVHAKDYANTMGFHPNKHCHAVIAVHQAIWAVWKSRLNRTGNAKQSLDQIVSDGAEVPAEPARIPESFTDAITARLDVVFVPAETNAQFKIVSDDPHAVIFQPAHMQKEGIGYTIASKRGMNDVHLLTTGSGTLKCLLRSKYVTDEDKKPIPHYLDYTCVLLDGHPIIEGVKTVWHDSPIYARQDVEKPSSEYVLHYEWIPHTTK